MISYDVTDWGKPLQKPVVSRNQSIQGTWDPSIPLHKMNFNLEHVMSA